LRSTIESLPEPNRDYEGLTRKIRAGVPIREAAKACGIPEDELLQYISNNIQKPAEISYELKRLAEATLIKGIRKLKEIADDGPRMEDEMTKYNNADLVAAQTLAKIGMDILKLSVGSNPESRQKAASATIQLDLWDQPGAWDLKKPGA